jgi:hypothetical protein
MRAPPALLAALLAACASAPEAVLAPGGALTGPSGLERVVVLTDLPFE